MLNYTLAVIAGFGALVWSADRLVVGAAATARNLGVPARLVGITIVGFGTSAPEVLISIMAAGTGNTTLAVGNALGSNITNITLVLGVAALVAPMTLRSETVTRELPLLLSFMLLALVLCMDGRLSRGDGAILCIALAGLIAWTVRTGRRLRFLDPLRREYLEEIPAGMPTGIAVTWTVVGFLVLLLSSRMLVWGAVGIAEILGVSELVIGLTVVAIGTSLPELAASVTAAWKDEPDIAVGNVLGSNMFNLLAVLGLPGLIHPAALPRRAIEVDFPAMIVFTLAFFAMVFAFRRPPRLRRWHGGVLLALFLGYELNLYFGILG